MSATSQPERDALLNNIESFLQQMTAALVPQEPPARGPGRPRVLPALCLWAGLLVCVLRGFSSQLALWRLLSVTGLWRYPRVPVTDQAVYNRLERGGTAPLEALFDHIRTLLAARLAPYAQVDLAPFAQEVVALDESTLDQVARRLPALRPVPARDDRLLPGKVAALFDLRRQQWCAVRFVPEPRQNEKVLARDLVAGLPAGSLVLADLGYFGFAWFDWLREQGQHYISRLRGKTSYTVQHVFYQQGDVFDGVVWLGAYRADQAAHAVRLVSFRVGSSTYRYITDVLDPTVLSVAQIAALYARRWDIELAFNLVKRHLKLHLWWSAKTIVIQQQLWAVLIIAQILQALRLEIAGRAGVDPYEVSMALLVQYLPELAREGQDPIAVFVDRGRWARFIRPSTRTVTRAPTIPPEQLCPLPPEVALQRTPRYARKA